MLKLTLIQVISAVEVLFIVRLTIVNTTIRNYILIFAICKVMISVSLNVKNKINFLSVETGDGSGSLHHALPLGWCGRHEQLPAWEDQLPVAFSAATRPHRLAQWAGRIPGGAHRSL